MSAPRGRVERPGPAGPETPASNELPGLSSAQVAARVREGRTNAYRVRTSRSVIAILRANVFTVFNAILATALVLVLLVGRWPDALFGFVMVLNTATGTLAEVRSKAKKQHVASDFPASMTTGEIITVYRNLASQKWTTLPDEQWMHGLTLAVEKRLAKQEASAQRAEHQKQVRERRTLEREAAKASSESTPAQDTKDSTNSSLSAEEIERRRVERRKARRRSGKKH